MSNTRTPAERTVRSALEPHFDLPVEAADFSGDPLYAARKALFIDAINAAFAAHSHDVVVDDVEMDAAVMALDTAEFDQYVANYVQGMIQDYDKMQADGIQPFDTASESAGDHVASIGVSDTQSVARPTHRSGSRKGRHPRRRRLIATSLLCLGLTASIDLILPAAANATGSMTVNFPSWELRYRRPLAAWTPAYQGNTYGFVDAVTASSVFWVQQCGRARAYYAAGTIVKITCTAKVGRNPQ